MKGPYYDSIQFSKILLKFSVSQILKTILMNFDSICFLNANQIL